MARKIGIIGGTFDPVHYGHLILAEHIRAEAGLDEVIFIPAMVPPHKQELAITSSSHRFNMAALAVSTNSRFSVSDIEIKAKSISYTIETLKKLDILFQGEALLSFLIGADTVLEIEKWYKFKELLASYDFIVGSRPGYLEKKISAQIANLNEKYNARVSRVVIPEVDISSTEIRNRIKMGKSIKYLTPESVENYIIENGLYR